MEKIVVSCMDRRLNSQFDEKNDGKTLYVRNAGGNVRGAEATIRYLIENHNIKELHLAPHKDGCGGVNDALEKLKAKGDEDEPDSALVKQFRSSGVRENCTLEELERKNEVMQKEEAERLFSKMVPAITSELVGIPSSASVKHEGKHFLVVTKPSESRYQSITDALGKERSDCYFIQAETMEEVIPSASLAITKLGIRSIELVAMEREDYRPMVAGAKILEIASRNLVNDSLSISSVKL